MFSTLLPFQNLHLHVDSLSLLFLLLLKVLPDVSYLHILVSYQSIVLWKKELEKTIRQVIMGIHFDDAEMNTKPLIDYLEQIKNSFLIVQQAFKKASTSKVLFILNKLSPESIKSNTDIGFSAGLFKKIKIFNNYLDTYNKIMIWFNSGKFTEELLAEIENNCQELFQKNTLISKNLCIYKVNMIDNYLEDKTTILNPEGYLTVVVENGSVNKKIPDRFYIEFIIGRDSECDIQFSDSVVSRKHARVF